MYERKDEPILRIEQLKLKRHTYSLPRGSITQGKAKASFLWRRVEQLAAHTSHIWLSKFVASKKFAVHIAFLSLMGIIAWQGRVSTSTSHVSLFYTLLSGEEVVEGPLNPSAYAQTSEPGVGDRLGVADATDSSIDLITFDDPEVASSEALGGNAVVGSLQPLVPEPGSPTDNAAGEVPTNQPKKTEIYTVEEGDTLASIAAKFNISVNTIVVANNLASQDTIHSGDRLRILPTTGVEHTVRSGDTLSEIAAKYSVKAKDILEYNSLGEEAKLRIGQTIIIPDGQIENSGQSSTRIVSRPLFGSSTEDQTEPTDTTSPAPTVPSSGSGLMWPTLPHGISQYFGQHGHTGIDIPRSNHGGAPPPIYSAGSGTVAFAGRFGGYGNLVIVDHGAGLSTYYGHLSQINVSRGEGVKKGEAVGVMGTTGRSTGIHLHFETRRSGRPVNPLAMVR